MSSHTLLYVPVLSGGDLSDRSGRTFDLPLGTLPPRTCVHNHETRGRLAEPDKEGLKLFWARNTLLHQSGSDGPLVKIDGDPERKAVEATQALLDEFLRHGLGELLGSFMAAVGTQLNQGPTKEELVSIDHAKDERVLRLFDAFS